MSGASERPSDRVGVVVDAPAEKFGCASKAKIV